jgi:DNA-binding FadR family transcriptional regulator
MDEILSPIQRQDKLPEQVSEKVKQLILTRRYLPGERLPTEREMGETFQVSRTVIREAIRLLEAKGLVGSQTGSGTYVRAIQGEQVIDSLGIYLAMQGHKVNIDSIMEVRRVLELQVVKLACERATEKDIKHLEHILDQMCESRNDLDTFSKWDLDFHLALASACKNHLFKVLIEPLSEILFELIWTASTTPGAIEDACEFHSSILNAIKERDADKSFEMMKKHLDQSHHVALEGLKHRKME